MIKHLILKIALLMLIIIFGMQTVYAYTSEYSEPTNILIQKGTYGTGVKWVQDMLNHNGYNLSVDGIFGNLTYNAVVNFQANKGLSVDGIVGSKTRMALKKYADYNSLPKFLRTNTALLGIIKNCKSYYANNNFIYSTATGARTIPADESKLYNGNYCVDCSTYVSWVLYEYALINGNISMQNYFNTQRSSSVFASIGSSNGNDFLKVVDKKTATKNVDLSSAKPGDIIVTHGHVEFFSSYVKTGTNTVNMKVYNCGSNSSIKVDGQTTSATKNISDISYILRIR